MKTKLLFVTLFIATHALAQMHTYEFKEASVDLIVEQYAEISGKRVDLVQGEHKLITLVAYKVSADLMLKQIEHALKKQNLKVYEISDSHLIVSWINVPEKTTLRATPRRRPPQLQKKEVQPEEDKPRVISITNDAYFIDDQEIELVELSEHLNPKDHIQINPTLTTPHKKIVSVMDECAKANIKNISFVASE